MEALAEVKPRPKPPARKKGSVGKRTIMLRNIADRALVKGVTPLEVMLANMRFFWGRAINSYNEFMEAAKKADAVDERGELIESRVLANQPLVQMLETHYGFRTRAQVMAVEAAPYTVPKLAAIAFKGEVNHKVAEIVDGMSAEEAAAAYSETLKLGTPTTADMMPGIVDAVAEEVADGS